MLEELGIPYKIHEVNPRENPPFGLIEKYSQSIWQSTNPFGI
jgi:hypothetical protein